MFDENHSFSSLLVCCPIRDVGESLRVSTNESICIHYDYNLNLRIYNCIAKMCARVYLAPNVYIVIRRGNSYSRFSKCTVIRLERNTSSLIQPLGEDANV